MPTKSSKMKSKGISSTDYPLSREKPVAERIESLLRDSAANLTRGAADDRVTEGLQAQIDALRSAFNTLADVVVEEMNRTKQEVLAEASIIAKGGRETCEPQMPTMEPRADCDLNRMTFDISTIQQQTKGQIDRVESGCRKDLETLSREVETHRLDTQ